MNKSSKIIIGLLIVILVAILGFGGYYVVKLNSKLDEKNNDTNIVEDKKSSENSVLKNEVKQGNGEMNVVDSQNTTDDKDEISIEDKLKLAVYIGDFESIENINQDDIVQLILSSNSYDKVNVLKYNDVSTDQFAKSLFGDRVDEEYNYSIFEYDANDVKTVVKKIFGVNLSTGVGGIQSIRYNNGKYYYLYEPADGESLTIRNIEKNSNTYTLLALSALDSEEAPDSEYTKFQVTLEDGIIKSVNEL